MGATDCGTRPRWADLEPEGYVSEVAAKLPEAVPVPETLLGQIFAARACLAAALTAARTAAPIDPALHDRDFHLKAIESIAHKDAGILCDVADCYLKTLQYDGYADDVELRGVYVATASLGRLASEQARACEPARRAAGPRRRRRR